ncbi:MAG: hypothetical protein R3C05_20745 [Pirellulaceae bacterium]
MKRYLTRAFVGTTFVVCLLGLVCSPYADADDLSASIAAAHYRPIESAEVQRRWQAARDALQAVQWDLRIAQHGDTWRKYLFIESLDESLKEPEQQEKALAAVTATIYRLAGLHDGIEKPSFVALRSRLISLRSGLLNAMEVESARRQAEQHAQDLEMFPDDPELADERPESMQQKFARRTELLSTRIASLASSSAIGSPRDAASMREIAEATQWLRFREQIPELLARVEQRFGGHNLWLQVPAATLGTLTARPVYEVEPIRETQGKAQITGHAILTGTAMMHPVAGQYPGQCEIRFSGIVQSTMNGRQGPVSFVLSGNTQLQAGKSVVLQSDRFWVLPASANAQSDLRTRQVCSTIHGGIGKLVRKIAGKKIAEERPQGQRDLSNRSRDSFLEQFNEDVAKEIAEARVDFEQEVLRSLLRLNTQADSIDFQTDPHSLNVALQFRSGIAVPRYQQPLRVAEADFRVALHESMIQAVTDRIYSGRKIENIRRELKVVGIDLSAEDEQEIPENFGIHFADEQPIGVAFSDNQIAVTLRGQQWFVEDNALVAMNVRFAYAIERQADRFVAVRQPHVDISAPEGQRGGRFIQQKNILMRRLLDELPADFVIQPIPVEKLSDPVDRLGSLSVTQFVASEGWVHAALAGDR